MSKLSLIGCVATVLSAFGLGSAPSARAEAARVEVDMMCPIVSVKAQPDGVLLIEIARGTRQGLVVGARGDVYAPRPDSGIGAVVARAELVEVGESKAIARTIPGSVVDAQGVAARGQLEVRALLPRDVHRGQVFELYLIGIEFLDNSKQPIIDPMLLLFDTTGKAEDTALARMVEAGREVVEFTHEFPQRQTRTRWKGKLVPEILEQNDANDYLEFLRFVRDYPGKYIGKPWKISETYATWLINFSPPGYADRLAELEAARGKDFDAVVKGMKESEVVSLIEWVRRRVSDLGGEALPRANAQARIVDQLIKARGGVAKLPPIVAAEVPHLRARIFDSTPGKALEAARLYREASARYLAVGSDEATLEGVIALNNAMSQLADVGRDDEALAALAGIRATIAERLPAIKNPMYAAHLESAEVFPSRIAARILKKRGQYRDIIALLAPLADKHSQVGARGAREKEMELLELIAEAHAKLGELELADALQARIAKRAAELGDRERQAKTAFSVGDMYYDRGRYEEAQASFERSAKVAEESGLKAQHAKALAARGQALWNMGKLADALAAHDAAMVLRKEIGDESGVAWQLVQVAKIRLQSGDREAARRAFQDALASYVKLGKRSDEADTRIELGNLHVTLKRFEDALGEFGQAREIYKALGQRVNEARATQRLATAKMYVGQHADAEKLIVSSVSLLEKTGDKGELISAKLWLARVRQNCRPDKSVRALLESLLPRDKEAEPGTTVDVLNELAGFEVAAGAPDKAVALANEALALSEKNRDTWRIIAILQTLRTAYHAIGDLEKTEQVMARAFALAKESGNKPAMVSSLQQLAWVYADTGRLSEARARAEEAVKLARETDDPFEVAWSLNTLSKVMQGFNDTRAELDLLEEANRMMDELNFRYGRAAILFNRALTYARLRDVARALQGYQQTADALGQCSDAQFEVALPLARGEALLLSGRLDEADAMLRGVLPVARIKNPGRVPFLLMLLARLESRRGRHDAAIAWAEEAAALQERATQTSFAARAMLGRVLGAAGRHDEARQALTTALQRARSAGGAVSWELLHQLALIEDRRGARADAINLLKEAVTEIEKGEVVLGEDSSARYHADKVEVFRLLVKLLLADNKVETALTYLERSKAAELRELGGKLGAGGDQNTTLAIELDVQEKRLQALLDDELAKTPANATRVEQLDQLIASAKKRRAEFMEKLDRNDALFDRYAVRPLQLEKLQQYLGPGVLVVAPVVLDDSLVVFAMTKDALTHYQTSVAVGEVDALVTGFVREADPKNALGVRAKASLGKLVPQAKRLYDLLLRPAIDALGAPKTLVVSPTGSLRYLPFGALHDGERFVIERSAVVNVTALDREKFAQPSPRSGPNLSVMALAPDGQLTASRQELAEVRRALGQVDVFEGKDASSLTLRQKIRVPGYDIVHLATHGRLDAKNPELSHIQLADKVLSYADIPTLSPTRTTLVVLSACQTAVLSGGSGIEIAGLAYQFQRGQVHSVMATLWEVDDRATADLMGHFYHEVRSGQSYADSLAAAQRKLIADPALAHPGFWAPFVLMGSP